MSKSSGTSAQASGGGIGLLSLLGLLFIGLKLGGVIDWSWWWVLAPFWAPLGVLIAIFLVGALVAGICAIVLKMID